MRLGRNRVSIDRVLMLERSPFLRRAGAHLGPGTPDPAGRVHGERQRLRRQLAQQLADDTAVDRPAVARQLLDLVVLDAHLDRWFRTDKTNDGGASGAAEPG